MQSSGPLSLCHPSFYIRSLLPATRSASHPATQLDESRLSNFYSVVFREIMADEICEGVFPRHPPQCYLNNLRAARDGLSWVGC